MYVYIYIDNLFAKAVFDNLQSEHISLPLDIQIPLLILELGIPEMYESGKRTVNLQPSDSNCISSAHGHFNASCCWRPIHLYLTWMFSLHSVLQAVLGLALWDRTVFWGKATLSFLTMEWFHLGEGKKAINKASVWNSFFWNYLDKVSLIYSSFCKDRNSRNSFSLVKLHGVNASPKTMCV